MMKRFLKKAAAVMTAAVMGVSLAACGSGTASAGGEGSAAAGGESAAIKLTIGNQSAELRSILSFSATVILFPLKSSRPTIPEPKA